MPSGIWLARKMESAHWACKKRLDWVVTTPRGNGYTSGAEGKSLVLIAEEDTPKGVGRIRLSTISDACGDVLTNAAQ